MVGSDSGAEYSSLPSGRKGGRSPQSQIHCGCRLAGVDSGPEGIGFEEKTLSRLKSHGVTLTSALYLNSLESYKSLEMPKYFTAERGL